jgi:hypothetical protein
LAKSFTPRPDRLLIVFAKTPAAGLVKTRLGAVVGAEQAAQIYQSMLDRVLAQSATNESWQQLVAITPESDAAWFECRGFEVMRQYGNDIGKRIGNALEEGFRRGASRVLIIGSDLPDLTSGEITAAFSRLDSAPAVIGPSADGGFYLFGATAEHGLAASRVLQADIRWSTPSVFAEVEALCQEASLSLSCLPVKRDIDTYDDWLDYQSSLERRE